MRNFLHTLLFEATPDGEGLGGEPDPVADQDGEPDPAAEPAAPDPEDAGSGFDYASPEFSQAVEERAAAATQQTIAQMIAEAEAAQAADQQPTALDPFGMEPEQFTEGLSSMFGKMLDERLAPLMPFIERQQASEADGFVSETIEALPELGKLAEFLPAPKEGAEDKRPEEAAQLIELAATGFLSEAEAHYGQGEQAAAAALRAGAALMAEKLQAVHEAGRASYKAEWERISQGGQEPGGGGGAVDAPSAAKDVFEAADRFWDRQQQA